MDVEDENPGESPDIAPEPATAPAVTLLMVTHNPGEWYDEVLESVAALEYPALDVVVVDAQSTHPVAPTVAAHLPDARVVRLEENRGFGRAINAALAQVDVAPLVILAHDDVAPDPGAVRSLVEEAFRSNAAIVGPKVVRWDDPQRLLTAGEGADKFGFPVAYVERGELDQEQHDAVRDVFNVPDGFTLVRTDVLVAVGGFDESGSWFADDLDLSWRVHVAGGRVLVAPNARVRHRESLGERRGIDDRRRHQFRHRLRTILGVYRPFTLVRILPQLAVVHLVEAVFALITGRPGQARDVLTAWTWNLRHLGSLRKRRATLNAVRKVSDSDLRPLQVRGSARVAAFFRGQLAVGEDPFGSATTLSRRLIDTVAAPGRRAAFVAWVAVALVMLVGSRHLLTRPIPTIGELVPFPEQVSPVLSEWASSWRRAGIGGVGFGASGELVVGLAVGLFLGAAGLLRTVLILGMFPLGLYGAWRLAAPAGSVRASIASLLAYLAIPIGFDSLATGSWRGLLAFGLMPWVWARVLRASGDVPFAAPDTSGRDLGAGPRMGVPPLWRQILALGALLALAAVVEPLWVVLPLALVVGMIPGSLAVGRIRGLLRMGFVALSSGLLAVVLHAPWAWELTQAGDWSVFTGGRAEDGVPWAVSDLLRFNTGPMGSSLFNAAVLVAAAYVLVVGRQWRLAWAARAWSVALASWGVVWAAGRGWLPLGLPPTEMLLAPAGMAMALSAGMGGVAFDADVRQRGFSWRQLASFVAAVSLAISYFPTLGASIGGRWMMPRSDHHQSLAFLDAEAAVDDFRVVWFGDPSVLPLTGWPLRDSTAYATTQDGTPVLQDLWPGAPEAQNAPLRRSLELAWDQDTTRLGRLLAPMGVRYLIVVDQLAPEPYGGTSAPAPPELIGALAQQLDLERIDVNPALTVYRNAAWAPRYPVLPAGMVPESPDSAVPEGMRQAAGLRWGEDEPGLGSTGFASAAGDVDPDSEVLIGSEPVEGWTATLDGSAVSLRPAFGWTAVAPVNSAGYLKLAWSTPLEHRLALAGQGAAIVVVAVLLYATRAEQRERRRAGKRSRGRR